MDQILIYGTRTASSFFLACFKGHVNTVQLLLSNRADINLCLDYVISPPYIACQNGFDRTVQLLLNNRADINFCMKDGVSLLYIAFDKRRYKIVNSLLNNGVDTSLASGWKVNSNLVDFFDKQDSTIVFCYYKITTFQTTCMTLIRIFSFCVMSDRKSDTNGFMIKIHLCDYLN